jgi:hypothetical protein
MIKRIFNNITYGAVTLTLISSFPACSSVREMAANTSHIVFAEAKPQTPAL